jgi:hypothetical protein
LPSPARHIGPGSLKGEQAFFEAQAFAPQEQPHRVVRNDHATRGQLVLQPMQRQMRRLPDPLHDE